MKNHFIKYFKYNQKTTTNPPSIPIMGKLTKKQGGFIKTVSFCALIVNCCFNSEIVPDTSFCRVILGRVEGLLYSSAYRAFLLNI